MNALSTGKSSIRITFYYTHRICSSSGRDNLNDGWIFMSNKALTVI